MAQNPRPRTSTTDDAQQEEAAALAEFAAADDTASDDDQTDAYGEPEDTTSDAPEFDDGLTGIAAIDENLTRLAGGASLAGASAGIDLQSAIDSVSEAFAPPQQQAPAAPPQAPTRQVAQLETESPATPEQAQAPDEDPLATRVAKIAPNITVTPEMVAAFKAENPLFAQYDDAQAGEVLKEIIARGIAQDEADREAATTEQGQDPEAQAQAGTQDATAAANAEKPYSLWEDVKGLPKAIGAGVVKSGLESYDLVNETVLGNAPNYSDWRRGFEGYYSNLGGVSGAAASVAQFGAAFVGVGKFAKLAKIPGLARGATTAKGIAAQGAAKGFAADYMAFDGMEGRLSDLVEQYPHLQNPITGYLATDENDTQAEGRLKNALEGLGIGATIDVVMSGMRAYRAHLKGDKAGVDAAIEEGSAHFDTLNKKAESVESQPKPEPVASETQPKPDAAAKGDSTATPQPEPGTAGGAQVSSTGIATPEQIRASEEAKAGAEGATKAGATSTGTGGPRFVSPEIEAKARELAERIGKMDAAGSTDIVEYDEALRGTERRQPTPSTFESFTSEADLRALIGTVEDEVLKGIDSSHTATGRISHKETQRLAQQFANDIEDDWGLLVERMSKDGDTMARLEARFVAYGRVTADLAQRVQDMAWNVQQFDKVGAGAFGSKAELEKAFAHNLALYAQLQDHLKGARAGTGRALAIMRYDEALRKGVKLSLDPDDLSATDWANGGAKEIAEKVLRARDHKSLAMIADPTKYAQARDALTSLYIKNILSGPVTHLVNIFGNTYAAIAHPAAKIVGGAVERDPKIMREGLKQYGFMVSESLNALHIAFDALKTGDNFLDPHRSKFTPDGRFPEALSASALSGGAVPDESVTGRALNFYFSALGKVSTDALGASDEFFKQTLYSSELAARAWSEGVDRGLKGAELKSFVRKQIDDGFVVDPTTGRRTAGVGEDAEAALRVARFNTFSGEVKPDGISANMLRYTNKYPELRFAVPFVRIISNLLEYTGTMTPGIASRLNVYKEAIARGGSEAAAARGRLAMGYALWTTAISAAASGMVTGDGPRKSDGSLDYQKLEMLKQSGWRPNSLKVGDTYINLSRLDPVGLPFNVAASAMEKFHAGLQDEKSWMDIGLAMSWGLGESMLDRAYLSGLADLFEAFNDDSGAKVEKYLSRLGASIVVPNFLKQTGRDTQDDNVRHARVYSDCPDVACRAATPHSTKCEHSEQPPSGDLAASRGPVLSASLSSTKGLPRQWLRLRESVFVLRFSLRSATCTSWSRSACVSPERLGAYGG